MTLPTEWRWLPESGYWALVNFAKGKAVAAMRVRQFKQKGND